MLSGWWHSATAQSHGGAEQYYTLQNQRSFALVPVIYFQHKNGWYAEARYNYEELETASVYAGRTFASTGDLAVAISPIAGLVAGRFVGGSVGCNIAAEFKNFSLSSQSQYTFSIQAVSQNFTYSWTDLSYKLWHHLAGGFSLQQTGLYRTANKWEAGVFLLARFKKWSMPLYVFNPVTSHTCFILGLQGEWDFL